MCTRRIVGSLIKRWRHCASADPKPEGPDAQGRARLTASGQAGAATSTRDILVDREAAGPAGLLPLPPSYLRPDKRGVPWARAVAGGVQVLICPDCQQNRPDWAGSLDGCEACGGTRLSLTLGQVVCRACGHTAKAGA